jgi:hypothetical protein
MLVVAFITSASAIKKILEHHRRCVMEGLCAFEQAVLDMLLAGDPLPEQGNQKGIRVGDP